MFKNKVLNKIFGSDKDQVSEQCMILHNKELLFSSLPNIVRIPKSSRLRWAGHVARMGCEMLRRRWADNIEMDHREISF